MRSTDKNLCRAHTYTYPYWILTKIVNSERVCVCVIWLHHSPTEKEWEPVLSPFSLFLMIIWWTDNGNSNSRRRREEERSGTRTYRRQAGRKSLSRTKREREGWRGERHREGSIMKNNQKKDKQCSIIGKWGRREWSDAVRSRIFI